MTMHLNIFKTSTQAGVAFSAALYTAQCGNSVTSVVRSKWIINLHTGDSVRFIPEHHLWQLDLPAMAYDSYSFNYDCANYELVSLVKAHCRKPLLIQSTKTLLERLKEVHRFYIVNQWNLGLKQYPNSEGDLVEWAEIEALIKEFENAP